MDEFEFFEQESQNETFGGNNKEVFAQMHNGNGYVDENNLNMAEQIFGKEEAREYGITD